MPEEIRRFRIWLKEPQFQQLLRLATRFPKEGHERLKTAIKSAQPRVYPGDEMSRKTRAEWVGDELLEQISEVETLLEEVLEWVQAARGTSFSQTAMFQEAERTQAELEQITSVLHDTRVRLKNLHFPNWQEAKGAADRKVTQLQERLNHEHRRTK